MTHDDVAPEFEAKVLEQRLDDLHDTHPGEAKLIADILQTLDYEKTTMRNALQVRAMVIALGYTFSQQGESGLSGLKSWLGDFVNQGALSPEQAATFTAQAQAI